MGFFNNIKRDLETVDGFAPKMVKASGYGCAISTLLIMAGMMAGPAGIGIAIAGCLGVLVNGSVFGYSAYKGFEKANKEREELLKPAAVAAPAAPTNLANGNALQKKFGVLPSITYSAAASGNSPAPKKPEV